MTSAIRGFRASDDGFATGRHGVWIGDWRFRAKQMTSIRRRWPGDEFAYSLTLVPNSPPMLNGADKRASASRTGRPIRTSASYYYSRPQLAVSGITVALAGKRSRSPTALARSRMVERTARPRRRKAGIGSVLNLADGGALMAFRLRRDDGTPPWAAATCNMPTRRFRFSSRKKWSFAPSPLAVATNRHRLPRSPVPHHRRAKPGTGALIDDQELTVGTRRVTSIGKARFA